MKILVTYKSKTGFTKRYAEIIAKKTGARLLDFKDVTADTMSEFDTVVYGGGLYAGSVNGLNKAKEMFKNSSAKKFFIFATGGTPNTVTEDIETVWKNNLTAEELVSIPHFYMQAGMCYEKMSLASKAFMKMAAGALEKKHSQYDGSVEFNHSIRSSYDISSPEYAEPLIKVLLEG